MAKAQKPTDMDGYISQFPARVRAVLEKVRETIKDAAPDATEVISYRMPAFRRHGILVYFAAWKNHVGLYPPISGDRALEDALARYAGPKGKLQFPLVKLRVKQDAEKAAKGKKSRASSKSRESK